MIKYSLFYLLTLLSGCTYSINMVHTEGMANDVVDEEQQASPVVSPNVRLPAVSIPKALVIR